MSRTKGFTRRDILKAAAVATALSAVPPRVFAETEAAELIHGTHFGAFRAVKKNGRLIQTVPHENMRLSTTMLENLADYVNTPTRIQRPCVRRSYLEGRRENHLRGAEEFVAVSWETALDLVAEKMNESKKEYGNESIFRTSFAGWANPGVINRPNTLQGRFLGLLGGFTDTLGDYSAGASTQIMPYVLGNLEVYGRQTSYEVTNANTKYVVLWGMDPLKSFKIGYGVPDFKKIEWFHTMKKNGVKFISIDPVVTDTARELGARWVKINPSTDTAMIIGMCGHMLFEETYSKNFIENMTVGFDVFKKYLTGESDGIKKTPEWAESICGISAEEIRELASLMLYDRTLIISLYGAQRTEFGEQFHWSLVALAAMLGHIGTPGGGLNLGGNWLAMSSSDMPKRIPQGRNPSRSTIPASRLGDLLQNPGKTIDFNGGKITYPNINLIHSTGANALTHHQDTNKLLRGLQNVETIITQEIVWTPWAKLSDIVLPANTTLEKNDLGFSSDYNIIYLWAMKKIVEPVGESRSDYWILAQLAERLGFGEEFTKGRTNMDWVRWSYENGGYDVGFDEFWERGILSFEKPANEHNYVHMADFVMNPKKNPLFTPSGKIELYSEKIASYGYEDCMGHPCWHPPEEWLGAEAAEKHPFHLLSIHPTHRLHSQMDNLPLRHLYKIDNREPVVINNEDAAELGINTGDLVEVYNDRGAIVCAALVNEEVMRGVVRIDEGAWYDPEEPGVIGTRCLSGNANVLTSDKPTSRLAQACTAHSCLVSLKRTEGDVKPNGAYKNPVVI